MCGIIGYVGHRAAQPIILDGLRRMEYRGYDSAGIALPVDGQVRVVKKAGKLENLQAELEGVPLTEAHIGIGHTRWATHGEPNDSNAHPHASATEDLRRLNKVVIVGCGTAYYAGMVAKYAIEHWTRIPCEVELASEFRYRDPIVDAATLCVTISQSGETADTLMAIRHAREQGSKVIAICNTNGATIPRESDAVIYTHAGPEIGVASTKGFLTQLVACYLLGLYLAQVRGTKFADEIRQVTDELERMPELISQLLSKADDVYQLARQLVGLNDFIFLGRHVGYPVALEGALKLKELAYQHAEGFAAGELKHGPIAIIESGMPVFVVVPPQGRDQLHDKMISNIQEVRARGGRVIALTERGDQEVEAYADEVIWLPKVSTLLQPLVATVPLQLFACELATALGNDVDQPRNLAKSVTVE